MDLIKLAQYGYLDNGMEKTAKDLRGHDLGADVAKKVSRGQKITSGLGALGGGALGYATGRAAGKPGYIRGLVGAGVGARIGSDLYNKRMDPSKNLLYKTVDKAVPGAIDPRDAADIYRRYGSSGVGYAVAKADKDGKFKRGNVGSGDYAQRRLIEESAGDMSKRVFRSANVGAGLGLAAAGGLTAATKKVDPAFLFAAPVAGALVGGRVGAGRVQRDRYMKDATSDYAKQRGAKPSKETIEDMKKYKDAGAYMLSNEYV